MFKKNKDYLIKDLAYPNHLEIAKGVELEILILNQKLNFLKALFTHFYSTMAK